MNKEAQAFMNLHKIKECFECDGVLFKRKELASIRSTASGKEVIPHTANAGMKTTEKTTPPSAETVK